jgi:tetratricopeptide (TPR) repeat protein
MTDYPEKPKRDGRKQKSNQPNTRLVVRLASVTIIAIAGVVVAFQREDKSLTGGGVIMQEVTAIPTATRVPRTALERAQDALEQGKFAEAAAWFSTALEENAAPNTFLQRAYAYYRMGDYNAALADYERVIAANSADDFAAWLGKTRVLNALYEQTESTATLKEAVNAASQTLQRQQQQGIPLSATDHLLLGNIFYMGENYRLALFEYEAYVEASTATNATVMERLTFLRTLE